jgi:hypothetical protein
VEVEFMAGIKGIRRFRTKLEDGREVVLFVNRKTNLIVVDVMELDDERGTEVCRTTAPAPWAPAKDKVA